MAKVVWVGIIFIFLVLGILSFYKPFVVWNIKFGNKMKGVKTKITPAAIMWAKVSGTISIIMALILLSKLSIF